MENGALIRRAILNPGNNKYGSHRHRKRSDFSAAAAAVVFTGKPVFPCQTCRNLFAISSVAPRSSPYPSSIPSLDCRSQRLRTPSPTPPRSSQGQEDSNSNGDGNGNGSGDGNPPEEKKGEAQDSEEGDGDRDRDGEAWRGGGVQWNFFNKRRVRVSSEKSPREEGGERRTDPPPGGGGLWKLFRWAEPAKREVSPPDGGIKLVLDGEEVEIRWRGLFDVSSPENLLAVVLAGTLALATLQIVWQLFLAVAAIALSALKYSVVAALLIGLIVFIL